jgi:hypothetical protein
MLLRVLIKTKYYTHEIILKIKFTSNKHKNRIFLSVFLINPPFIENMKNIRLYGDVVYHEASLPLPSYEI